MKVWKRTISGVAAWAISVGAVYLGANMWQDHQFAQAQQKVDVAREDLSKAQDIAGAFRSVGKVVEPSVVNINVRKSIKASPRRSPFDDPALRKFFRDRVPETPETPDSPDQGDGDTPETPDSGDFEQIGTGSGVIMEAGNGKGWIVTNNHVAGGAQEMIITLWDGREIRHAKLLGADAKSDLAVIEVQADRLIAAKWGNSDELTKGDWVLAFGSPFGYVGSMTHGIVSALNRQAGLLGAQGYENFIQVDAPINPGNSGGPLVNLKGEVVGINTAIASRSGGFQGIGFAIPSNQATFIYNSLKEKGKVVRGWLGVSISDVSRDLDKAHSFGFKGEDGVLVEQILPGTPATGKLMPGDIITEINGKSVKNVPSLRNVIAAIAPGADVKFQVFREGKAVDVAVKLGEQPADLTAVGSRSAPATTGEGAAESLGIRVSSLSEELASKYGIADVKTGAVVTQVAPRSPAAHAGFRTGDVITRVGTQAVTSAGDFMEAVKKEDLHKGVRFYVTSREGSRFVFVRAD